MLTLISQVLIKIGERKEEISPLNSFSTVVEGLIQSLLFFSSLLVLGYMLWGALDWITAGGDSGKIESARKKITQSIIGLVVLFSVGALFLVLQWMLGISVLESTSAPAAPPCVAGDINNPCLVPF